MTTSAFWYAMLTPEGKPQGYAHLGLTPTDDGGTDVSWELKLAFTGGTYEESRSMRLSPEQQMLSVAFADSTRRVEASRRGRAFVGEVRLADGTVEAIDVETPEDAIAGLGFVLAASMPLEKGAEQVRHDINEAAGFKEEGEAAFKVVAEDSLDHPQGTVEAWRVVMVRDDGRELPIWVNADREIVQVDWGGGNLMVRSETSTEHLFQPLPPIVAEIEGEDKSGLALQGTYEGITAARMFAYWTDPQLLPAWWPEKAEVEARQGGQYVLSWTEPDWVLRGEITKFEPGRQLGFTWAWDHKKDAAVTEVVATFEDVENGSRVHITHGPYEDTPQDMAEREGHLHGWLFFCAKLKEAIEKE